MKRDGMTYAAREDIKNALDVLETSRAEPQIDRVLRSATDMVEGMLKRRFYPEVRTMTFDWPDRHGSAGASWKLYLNQHELISVTSLTSGGAVIPPSEFMLRPDDGPPFTRIETDLSTSSAFEAGSTTQRAISVSGVFGYSADENPAGTLAAGIDASVTTVDVSDGSLVGVGNLLRAGTERMVATGRSFLDSAEDLAVNVTAASQVSITVTDGSAFNTGETILIDAERMLITDIAGNVLAVKRAWDGTTLEAHTAPADVYVSRRLTVVRGALGTTAAAHLSADPLFVHAVPPLIQNLTVAEGMAQLVQERTGYARTIGSGEGEREVRGVGLADLREQAMWAYGRRMRTRAV